MLPYDVFILRGATEYLTYRPKTRFPKRLCGAIAKLMARLFDTLPLAALINFRILAVHSGIDAKVVVFFCIYYISFDVSNILRVPLFIGIIQK